MQRLDQLNAHPEFCCYLLYILSKLTEEQVFLTKNYPKKLKLECRGCASRIEWPSVEEHNQAELAEYSRANPAIPEAQLLLRHWRPILAGARHSRHHHHHNLFA